MHQKQCLERKGFFKVDISGDERNIAAAIDKYLNQIKDKYGIVRNNQVAILCRSNSTAFKVGENLSTPYKIFEETVLDRDNSEWGRFFRDLLSASFDESVFAVDYAEQLFLKNWNLKNIEKHSRCAKVYFRIRSMIFAMQRIR